MGSQIAALLVNNGVKVQLLDIAIDDANPNKLSKQGYDSIVNPKKSQLYDATFEGNLTYGNFIEDLNEMSDSDIFIEAVKEDLKIKQDLWKQVASVAKKEAILATNTSGIPINLIAQGLPEDAQQRFIGLHFFNPPRYMKLVEIIPADNTKPEIVEELKSFAEDVLGKGVVLANDVTAFVANRTGIHTLADIMYRAEKCGYSITETDALTGKVIGRPMGTYALSDLVGNDVGSFVIQGLLQDPGEADYFNVSKRILKLVENGYLGNKTKKGFYKKEKGKRLVINPETLNYSALEKPKLPILDDLGKKLEKNLAIIFEDQSKEGIFLWETLRNVFVYAARNVPLATDEFIDIDRAMVWGFNWRQGPFQLWDSMGFERVKKRILEEGYELPEWILERDNGFYTEDMHLENVTPISELITDHVWDRDSSSLNVVGEQLLFKIQTKYNVLDDELGKDLIEAIDELEQNHQYTSMVIYSEGPHFSLGANLVMMKFGIELDQLEVVEESISILHQAVNRLRYSTKPIVTATQGRALGGGAELLLASPYIVAAAESYIGLVEVGVGLLPAGGGLAELTERVMTLNSNKSNKIARLSDVLMNVASAKVAMSAYEARKMYFLKDQDTIIANGDKRVQVALEKAKFLGSIPYQPRTKQTFKALGRDFKALAEGQLDAMRLGHFISDYDMEIGLRIAEVISGGDVPEGTFINQEYLQNLEKEHFISLCGNQKTYERISHMLETKKPLRN